MTAPEDRPDSEDLQQLVDGVNGFVYPGSRLDAVIETVNWLRANSDVAVRLLGLAALSVAPQPQPATCKHGRAAKHFIPRGTVGAWGEWCPGPVSAAAPEQL